ncbi:hypothetical protein BDA99DRAFT_51795 [Phascolomyces articulosus]|uniref:Uncharacterized protein n=1 Tax=Phascolomyces articulosus TaxID=60185 RepID=A0AAD5PG74_9FUNG|nr:hypothetical protein BDA99DRAFT_51795 [Phascolomyces articulosus]
MSSIRQELLGQQEQQNDVFPEEYSSYQARLCKAMPAHLTSCTEDRQFQIPLKSNGHWISRWKTSDRSLFIMFYQRYHIHLNAYIDAAQGKSHHHHPSSKETLPIQSRNIFLTLSPGYVHLASYLTEKVGSLLRSSIVEEMPWSHDYTATAVAAASTTSTQQQQQTPSSPSLSSSSTTAVAKTQHDIAELARPGSPAVLPMVTPTPSPTSSSRPASPLGTTANNGSEVASVPPRSNSPNSMAAPEIHVVPVSTNDTQQVQTYNGKPKGLDSAARRYAYCLTSCAIDPSGSASESNSRHQNKFDIIAYQDMINVWLRSITKSVSWTSPESVFCLIDFFENVINELQKKQYNGIYPWVDIPFILHTIHLLLTKADNTIIHMRTLAFVFTNFGFLTQRPELLDMLCNKILLHPYLFERFMVHWNSGVRIFFLQCLFWRIRPLWTLSTVQWGFKDGLKSSCDGSKCWNAWNEQYHNGKIYYLMFIYLLCKRIYIYI